MVLWCGRDRWLEGRRDDDDDGDSALTYLTTPGATRLCQHLPKALRRGGGGDTEEEEGARLLDNCCPWHGLM